ncbi:MAG TPA: DoxX family protein [Gemmatimonadaceae bacterium]|nr:DoxX family protein [Gemmatimonadaceae bacterium]
MERPRASIALAATILSVLLAGVFLAAGVPKLVGAEPLILQAAAMRGFPEWIRIVVAVVEVIGAIGLLIPATSAVAATLLALLMVPAAITQRVSGEPGILVPAALFLLLLVLAAMRRPDAVRNVWREARHAPHPVFREGVIAGVIGATAIAVWFFVVDLVAGQALFTPSTLGRAVFSVLGAVPDAESPIIHVLAYTLFHYAAFITVGIVAAAMVRLAGDEPSVLMGFVILFVAFEVGFYAFVAVLSQVTPLGGLAWWQVMVGNLIAAGAMGFYLLRRHPVLREQFRHSLDAQPWRAAARERS